MVATIKNIRIWFATDWKVKNIYIVTSMHAAQSCWPTLYMYVELCIFCSADPTKQALMKGGEACAWSEYIDPTNIISLLW
jgi:hypothetical protein